MAADADKGRAANPARAAGAGRADPGTSVRAAPPRRVVPPKLYRMGEIVEYAGLSRQTIHNYSTMGLLTESGRTDGGHRLYDEAVFARLDLIAEMKRQNRSLRDIRRHFDRMDAEEVGGG